MYPISTFSFAFETGFHTQKLQRNSKRVKRHWFVGINIICANFPNMPQPITPPSSVKYFDVCCVYVGTKGERFHE